MATDTPTNLLYDAHTQSYRPPERGHTYRILAGGYFESKYDPQTLREGWRCEAVDTDVLGVDWLTAARNGTMAALVFARRVAHEQRFDPTKGNVYYGKMGALGELVHEFEILAEVSPNIP